MARQPGFVELTPRLDVRRGAGRDVERDVVRDLGVAEGKDVPLPVGVDEGCGVAPWRPAFLSLVCRGA